MTEEELYAHSNALNELTRLAKGLDQFHYYRYRILVDGSEFGIECSFAKRTKELGVHQLSDLRGHLTKISDIVAIALAELEEPSEDQTHF
jgi:hypothetical protein